MGHVLGVDWLLDHPWFYSRTFTCSSTNQLLQVIETYIVSAPLISLPSFCPHRICRPPLVGFNKCYDVMQKDGEIAHSRSLVAWGKVVYSGC